MLRGTANMALRHSARAWAPEQLLSWVRLDPALCSPKTEISLEKACMGSTGSSLSGLVWGPCCCAGQRRV